MIISVDIDGTLLLGVGFDIKSKKPNRVLIDKINYLKSCGNYIKIVTARGAYNSTIEERTAKYYPVIKEFLDTNGILYDEISFNKEFADLYIDDLAVRPEEVIVTKDMSSGFTDNVVTRINDTVVKSGKTILDEYEWYSAYERKDSIPEVLNITRNSIVYKYIERSGSIDFELLLWKVNAYSNYPKLNSLKFDSYVSNIKNHLSNNLHITNGDKLLGWLQKIDVKPTFAHGDLSIDNIIQTSNGIVLIDPLYSSTKYGSVFVDYAKLLFSVKFYYGDIDCFIKIKNMLNTWYLDILVASEAVRVSSYKKQFSFIAENLINEL